MNSSLMFTMSGMAAAASLLSLAAALPAYSAEAVLAQRPITLIIPLAPGGPNDVEARMYTSRINGNLLSQNIVLDYKPGASGTISAAFVARAVPDGHTLQLTGGSFGAFPALYKDLPFDTIKDFTHISLVSLKNFVLVVHPSLPIKSFPDYVAYTRANPEKMNISTTGSGGSTHLGGAWLHNMINTKATFVHYKGAGPAVIDLVAGRVQATPLALQTSLALIKSGKIRPVAMMGSNRSDAIPGLATIAEQGFPGYAFESYIGISGPTGMPAGAVKQLNEAFAKVVKMPDVVKQLDAQGSVPVGSTPGEFSKPIQAESERWKKVVRDNNITLEE